MQLDNKASTNRYEWLKRNRIVRCLETIQDLLKLLLAPPSTRSVPAGHFLTDSRAVLVSCQQLYCRTPDESSNNQR